MPRCTPVTPATRDTLVRLLGELRVPLGTIGGAAMHRAVAADAAAGRREVVALLADLDGAPAGFVVATLDTGRYWRTLLLRRLGLLVRVLAARLSGARRRSRQAGSDGAPAVARAGAPAAAVPLGAEGDAPRRWQDDGADVAKIAFIGVLPAFRRRGVGEALYAALFAEAARRGARVVLARIAADNAPSLRLHQAAGWRLFGDAHGPFAVYPLDAAPAAFAPAPSPSPVAPMSVRS